MGPGNKFLLRCLCAGFLAMLSACSQPPLPDADGQAMAPNETAETAEGPQTEAEAEFPPAEPEKEPDEKPDEEPGEEPDGESGEEPDAEPDEKPDEEPDAESGGESTGDADGPAPAGQTGQAEYRGGSRSPTPAPAPVPAPTPRPEHLDNIALLPNARRGWYFMRQQGAPPRGAESAAALRPFDAFYIGDTGRPRVFLTFDSGYEAGFTPEILDTLLRHDVRAAFFLTESYIRRHPGIVQRKIDEGHVVANHSATHRDFTALTDDEIASELLTTAERFREVTGQTMAPFFRPPAGAFSWRVLALAQEHGFNTVFWSFAYRDWVVAEQPTVEEAFRAVVGSLHNGMVILLHTNSEANTRALSDIIEAIKERGFEFAPLYELLE